VRKEVVVVSNAGQQLSEIRGFIIAKNEAPNIERAVSSLVNLGLEVTVLDSGSTDGTCAIAERAQASVVAFNYIDHCSAYNEVTSKAPSTVGCLIIDADMIVSASLWAAAKAVLAMGAEVVRAKVSLTCAGRPLRFASLYPPKPFLFRGGTCYFRPSGHGEALVRGVSVVTVSEPLVHDDRKRFGRHLATQHRYALQLADRQSKGQGSWMDWVRLYTPFSVLAIAPYIVVARLGLLDGRAGLQYALERVITEAMIFREGLRRL